MNVAFSMMGLSCPIGWMYLKAEERRWRREYAERRAAYERLRKHGCPALEAMRVSHSAWAAERAKSTWSASVPTWFVQCGGPCCSQK